MDCTVIGVGGENKFFPYPNSENWQKTIGAHFIFGMAVVNVSLPSKKENVHFQIVLKMFVEDMYNFNPNNKDIETGIPDNANGRFEITKLAKEYLNTAEFNREYSFDVAYEDLNSPSFAAIENEKIATPRK